MLSHADIDLIVFDVLGTLVDEPGGLRDGIREAAPELDAERVDELAEAWQRHIAERQRPMLAGHGPYADSDALGREAAELVASECGVTDPAAIDRLAAVERRLDPWPDTVESLDRLARRFALAGLSNASRATLARLNAHVGMRWHFVLSAEDARNYKPAPEVYRLAVDLGGGAPERVLMVAAHAWDLRGAQAVGMRTAYVRRPVGDPPLASDSFDFQADGLAELVDTMFRLA